MQSIVFTSHQAICRGAFLCRAYLVAFALLFMADVVVADAGDPVAVKFAEPYKSWALASGGGYIAFHLPTAKTVEVFDTESGKKVNTIEEVSDDVMLCGSKEKLLLVLPGQKMIQRYDLVKFRRERIAACPVDSPKLAVLGNNGSGPLALWQDGSVVLFDINLMKPIKTSVKLPGGSGRYGYKVSVSADGNTFTGIVTGISSQRYTAFRVDRNKVNLLGQFGGTSNAHRYGRPTADGRLYLARTGFYDAGLRQVATDWLKDATCFPTSDPRFFVAVRFVEDKAHGSRTKLEICSTGDRQVVATAIGFKDMAPQGNTNSRRQATWQLSEGQWRFHVLPIVNRIVTLPYTNDRMVITRYHLMEELAAEGPYILVTSSPPTLLRKGHRMTYKIQAQTNDKGDIQYELVSGPPGARVTAKGAVLWSAPRTFKANDATMIVRVMTEDEKTEVFHTINLDLRGKFD